MIIRISKSLKLLLREGDRLGHDEDGQILVFTALAGLVLVMMVVTIFNTGMVIGEKIKVQNTADAAAYSQAVWEARVLNFLAYTNRAIISHMVTIAFCTAVFSQRELWIRVDNAVMLLQLAPFPVSTAASIIRPVSMTIRYFWEIAAIPAEFVRAAALVWVGGCFIYQTVVMGELSWKISKFFWWMTKRTLCGASPNGSRCAT